MDLSVEFDIYVCGSGWFIQVDLIVLSLLLLTGKRKEETGSP